MQKKIRKLTLSRETLCLLSQSDLEKAAGGLFAAAQLGGGSFDRTCQSLCFICPDTWTIGTD